MTPEERVGGLLRAGCRTVSTAESCTGGGLAARITSVPGASVYFRGGLIAYDNRIKSRWLGVPEETLRDHGAVSPETARAMAEGIRIRFETHYGIGVTGIAGPDGGTADKPPGLVFIALADAGTTRVRRHQFRGSRAEVQRRAVDAALEMLLARLIEP